MFDFALVVAFLLGCVVLCLSIESEDEANRSFDYHYTHGRYRVLYPDGQLSQPFLPKTAHDYAEMHGGKVVPVNYQVSKN